jgi:hypothetical protein
MNAVTKEIANLLGVSVEQALKVQTYIEDAWLLDFSECSERKFKSVVRQVANEVLA